MHTMQEALQYNIYLPTGNLNVSIYTWSTRA